MICTIPFTFSLEMGSPEYFTADLNCKLLKQVLNRGFCRADKTNSDVKIWSSLSARIGFIHLIDKWLHEVEALDYGNRTSERALQVMQGVGGLTSLSHN